MKTVKIQALFKDVKKNTSSLPENLASLEADLETSIKVVNEKTPPDAESSSGDFPGNPPQEEGMYRPFTHGSSFSQSLREDCFLSRRCERPSCAHHVHENSYKFCPKCGYTTIAVYDYYRLLGLHVTREGDFDENLLKKNFRELSRHYHPDAQLQNNERDIGRDLEMHWHDNFSFLSQALEVLKSPQDRFRYHHLYQEAIRILFPERFTAMAESSDLESHSEGSGNQGFSIRDLGKRLFLFVVTILDISVMVFIVYWVTKAYLWGVVLSLAGAWLYFRKTRKYLNRLYTS